MSRGSLTFSQRKKQPVAYNTAEDTANDISIMAFELRGSKLIAVILLASGLDFLLFGCGEYNTRAR